MAPLDYNSTFEIIRVLGSLASMISASISVLKFYKEKSDPISDEQRAVILEARDNPIVPKNRDYVADKLRKIPDRFLEVYRKRIEFDEQTYLRIVSNKGSTVLQVTEAEEVIGSRCCDMLRLVKRHNGGELPKDDPYYFEVWGVFGCDARPGTVADS